MIFFPMKDKIMLITYSWLVFCYPTRLAFVVWPAKCFHTEDLGILHNAVASHGTWEDKATQLMSHCHVQTHAFVHSSLPFGAKLWKTVRNFLVRDDWNCGKFRSSLCVIFEPEKFHRVRNLKLWYILFCVKFYSFLKLWATMRSVRTLKLGVEWSQQPLSRTCPSFERGASNRLWRSE